MLKEDKIQYIDNRDFTGGLNTIDDPVVLQNSESPYMINVDIQKNGSVITRYGYEEVAHIGGTTGAIRGILPYYNTYGTYKGDYFLVFHSNGNLYSIKNSDFVTGTSVDIAGKVVGSYGTDGGSVYGCVFNNIAFFGNGLAANTVKKYDGNAITDLGTPIDGSIFGTFGQRAFMSGVESAPSAVYYSDVDDPTTWNSGTMYININVGDGQHITGLVDNNDFLIVFKEDSIYGIEFTYDSTYNLSIPLQKQIVTTQGGAITQGCIQPVYGYTFYLSSKGFESYGPNPQRIVADMPIPLSFKIDPTIQNINFSAKSQINSTFYKQRYMCSVPFGSSTTNNYIFIYDENIKRRFAKDNWTVYEGIPALMFAKFRDDTNVDKLYFCSTVEPKIYKFNSTFSDNGDGYNRVWRSKTFTFGERSQWRYIDIEGSKSLGSTLYVDIQVDNRDNLSIEINDSNFIPSPSGGYIGDNYSGDAYIGSAVGSGEITPLYKFKKRIRIPDNVNYGYQMWFQLRNNLVGEGWKLSRYVVAYVPDPNDPSYTYTD